MMQAFQTTNDNNTIQVNKIECMPVVGDVNRSFVMQINTKIITPVSFQRKNA